MSDSFFAPCPRGLEALLADELVAVGASEVRPVPGGVSLAGDRACCYRANLESRLATRILRRVAHGAYAKEDDIYRLAREVPWPRLFEVSRSIRVGVNAIRCPLRSLDFLVLRIKDAICDAFRDVAGARPSVNTRSPDVRVAAFLTEREASLYLDTSGEPLYKRGFKRSTVEAPLKENLAAGILQLTGWTPAQPLLDPMCGSGSFLIEAAQIALGIAPGLGRGFGFERLLDFDDGLWRHLQEAARARCRPPARLPIFGSDLYGEQLKRARENLERAGLADAVQLKQANILELPPPAARGVLVANPPYGARIGDREELASFYPRLGDALKRRFAGWRCYLFSADKALAKLIGLRCSRRVPLYNGALECRLYEYRIVEGGLKPERAA
jgi:putative N6-adenine-specific DNA methylase